MRASVLRIAILLIVFAFAGAAFSKEKTMTQNPQAKAGVRLAMTILYVKDQKASADFYKKVLDMEPELDVPGMTMFTLENGSTFGLMPEDGIKSILGEKLPNPSLGAGIPRAELYFQVTSPSDYHQRVLDGGGKELSPLLDRAWGEKVAYSMDLDGHVIAFAGN